MAIKTKAAPLNDRTSAPGKKRRKKRSAAYRAYLSAFIILLTAVIISGSFFGYFLYMLYNQDGVYPGVRAAGIELAGMSRHEAAGALEEQMQSVLGGMSFSVLVDEDIFEITTDDLGIEYNVDTVAAEAYNYGREGSFFARAGAVLRAKTTGYVIELNYTYNLDAFDRIASEIADKVNTPSSETTYEIADDELIITLGASARHIDPLIISTEILDKFKNGTAGDITLTAGDGGYDEVDLEKIKSEIDCEPVDAYLDIETDPDNPVIVPEVNGMSLDLATARTILGGAGTGSGGNVFKIPLTIIEAAVKREDVIYFTYNDLISVAKTTLNQNNINRTSNIKLACSKINEIILYPGDEFSFNKIVGERTYAAGFLDASIYLAGEIVDGVGGGICQVSSTLYMAAVGADLEIKERRNHRYTVTYTELGEDATVAYDSKIDFKFVNNTEYAIKIHLVQESNYVLCEFYGTLTDETRNKTVSMESTVSEYVPYETLYEVSDEVEVGETKVKNAGYSGYIVEVERVTKVDGKVVSRTKENKSSYTKLDKVILINAEEAEILDDGTVVYVPIPKEPVIPDPVDPGEEDPGEEDPGGEDPGGEDPGGEDPGGEDPGGEDPGGEDIPDDLPDWLR